MFKITYRDPINKNDTITVEFDIFDNPLARDWRAALKKILEDGNHLEKNFCMMGFPYTPRKLGYLCNELNRHVRTINDFALSGKWKYPYVIEDYYSEDTVRFDSSYPVGDDLLGLKIKHTTMNILHNHFEILQGTVENPSNYFLTADVPTRYAIRQLNLLCHEIENLILAQRKAAYMPQWVRPSQITTFIDIERYDLKKEHRELFNENGYNRRLGGVYMHWCQIGKTLFEVWRDEGAPELTDTVCDAITHLRYYSGEFDIDWGNDVITGGSYKWHNEAISEFTKWLVEQGLDPADPNLSLGYLPIAQANLQKSFGFTRCEEILPILGKYLDIYKIEIDGVSRTYDYSWADPSHEQQQIEILRRTYRDQLD